jgi:hypothetical protein
MFCQFSKSNKASFSKWFDGLEVLISSLSKVENFFLFESEIFAKKNPNRPPVVSITFNCVSYWLEAKELSCEKVKEGRSIINNNRFDKIARRQTFNKFYLSLLHTHTHPTLSLSVLFLYNNCNINLLFSERDFFFKFFEVKTKMKMKENCNWYSGRGNKIPIRLLIKKKQIPESDILEPWEW